MTVKLFSIPTAVIVVIAAVFLCGCASPSPRFYTLTPIQNEVAYKGASQSHRAVIGIGPIKMAEYLENSKIVTRPGDNQVVKAEFDRWAGSLKNNFINVLAEDIGFFLPSAQILLYPFRTPEPVDYQVMVDVIRFDGQLGQAVWLDSRWTIVAGPENKLIKTHPSSIVEPVTGSTYGDLVAAESRALGKLSQEIARALKSAGGI
jgi:uncharacterized lipoprotein YmbA